MRLSNRIIAVALGGALAIAAGCGRSAATTAVTSSIASTAAPSTSTSTPTSTSSATSITSTSTTSASSTLTTPTSGATTTQAVVDAARPVERVLVEQTWAPFASYGEVVLIQPSIRIERIGFHESNHDGARQLIVAADAVRPIVLESRDRGTGSSTAADIVVQPDTELRAPVTGTVKRAGGYILYCDYNDDFVVIEPDAHPGWEVKLLHISGVMVEPGDRVEAGVTPVAPRATPLPFDSQVDEHTAEPSWPHVHLELVDPSIPDRPSPGGGC